MTVTIDQSGSQGGVVSCFRTRHKASERLRVARPCAQSRSTVHPEHKGPETRHHTPSALSEFMCQWFLVGAPSLIPTPASSTLNVTYRLKPQTVRHVLVNMHYSVQKLSRMIGSGGAFLDVFLVIGNIFKFTIYITLRLVIKVR